MIKAGDPAIHDLPPLLQALCLLKRDQWDQAHQIADDLGGPDGDWLHAHIHRVEGDLWNADYWYRRAGRQRPSISLEDEWQQMAQHLLEKL